MSADQIAQPPAAAADPTGPPPRLPAGSRPLVAARRRWPWPFSIYQSAVGRKWVMALTGVALLVFVLGHMAGNLHLYEGPARMHEYAETLRNLGADFMPRTALLWLLRVGLIVIFVVHLHSAYTLARRSRLASDKAALVTGQKKYASRRDYIAANYASRTMRWTGPIVGLYVLFHLADLTWGWWLGDDFVRGDPHHNIVASFGNLVVALIYVAAVLALSLHIFHGTWSIFQSFGVNNPWFNRLRRHLATLLAVVVLVGNLSFPVLTFFGVVNEDDRTCPINDTAGIECLAEEAEAH